MIYRWSPPAGVDAASLGVHQRAAKLQLAVLDPEVAEGEVHQLSRVRPVHHTGTCNTCYTRYITRDTRDLGREDWLAEKTLLL